MRQLQNGKLPVSFQALKSLRGQVCRAIITRGRLIHFYDQELTRGCVDMIYSLIESKDGPIRESFVRDTVLYELTPALFELIAGSDSRIESELGIALVDDGGVRETALSVLELMVQSSVENRDLLLREGLAEAIEAKVMNY
jgi:hypothetical protein